MAIAISEQGNAETSDALTPAQFGIQTGHPFTIFVGGTFASATAAVEVSPTADGPWVGPDDLSFDDQGFLVNYFDPRMYIRMVTSGGGTSTSVSLWILQGS